MAGSGLATGQRASGVRFAPDLNAIVVPGSVPRVRAAYVWSEVRLHAGGEAERTTSKGIPTDAQAARGVYISVPQGTQLGGTAAQFCTFVMQWRMFARASQP